MYVITSDFGEFGIECIWKCVFFFMELSCVCDLGEFSIECIWKCFFREQACVCDHQ